MSVSAGIVGLPNVGKSTLFNALTNAGAQSANYAFCTIDPNIGEVPVPDPRLKKIESFIQTEKVLPARVRIVDIAGLVRGASKGEGLGNKFLANIREVDAILHVVRCFSDSNVVHVEDRVDPLDDISIIETELIMADLNTIEKRLDKARRAAKTNKPEDVARLAALERAARGLEEGKSARHIDFDPRDLEFIHESHLLTIKPVLYVANVDEDDLLGESEEAKAVKELAASQGAGIVCVCAAIEAELAELDDDERQEMLDGLGIDEPALGVLARETYSLLGLQSFFTAGDTEIRAWTVPVGATAPEAAGAIHTDFEKRFIRAEVYTLDDLETHQDEAGIRAAGKLRLEGREYVVEDGDILHIRHNA